MRGRKRLGAGTVTVWCAVNEGFRGQPSGVERIVSEMRERKVSKLELARRSGCSNATIHKLLNGEMRSCSPSLAIAITEALGLRFWDVFTPRSSISVGHMPNRSVAA